jgi:hypothetical protein
MRQTLLRKTILAGAGLVAAVCLAGGAAHAQVVTMPAGTTFQVILETHLNTKESKAGDKFKARMVMPIFVNEQEVLPVGGTVEGTVVRVQEPGRVGSKAEMQLSPEKITLPNGDVLPLSATITGGTAGENTKVDSEEGTVQGSGKPKTATRSVLSGTSTGAILGAVVANQAGAGIGTGAIIGAGAVAAILLGRQIFRKGNDADLPAGSEITLQLNRALTFNPTMQEVAPAPPRNANEPGVRREDRRPELTRHPENER